MCKEKGLYAVGHQNINTVSYSEQEAWVFIFFFFLH